MQRKGANFSPKVKVGILKFVRFLNSSFIKRAKAFTFELHEGTIYSFVKFKYESFSSNIEQALEKTNKNKQPPQKTKKQCKYIRSEEQIDFFVRFYQ